MNLCKDMGINAHTVSDNELGRTIEEIAGLSSAPKSIAGSGKPVPFTDEMMVFCRMDPDSLDRFLKEYCSRDISPVLLKAVMTPFNARWTPGRLCMELKKEQQSI